MVFDNTNQERTVQMNNNLLAVFFGDMVRIVLNSGKTYTIKVQGFEKRYGRNSDGTRINPLVSGLIIESEDEKEKDAIKEFDISFVREIICRAKLEAPKRNVFREAFNDGYRVGKMGKCWVGSLSNLVTQALTELDLELDRHIHEERLRALYEKSYTGFVGHHSCYIKVNPKKFTKWVANNWHRILMTSREMHNHANEQLKREREELNYDMRRMWHSMMDDELDRQDQDDADLETELVRH